MIYCIIERVGYRRSAPIDIGLEKCSDLPTEYLADNIDRVRIWKVTASPPAF
jgi:hypothetical protein